ncbi:MAG: nucleotide-binding protein [Syntrophomonadaceae bacterium]|nr:nucleotide-binding protein [Syntrophomonadaceae bacterium]
MSSQIKSLRFKLNSLIQQIETFPQGEWKRVEIFENWVDDINQTVKNLEKLGDDTFIGIPLFKFVPTHYSQSCKTINDRGYEALKIHLNMIKQLIDNPTIIKNTGFKRQDTKHKVFLVHGKDNNAKAELESLIYRVGLEPVVLHRQANLGKTIIEKVEKYSEVDYAVVLLTPDDVGALFVKDGFPDLKPRARQNVLFELGYFCGLLGRSKVSCIMKSTVEKPSDIDGIVYLPYSNCVDEIEYDLRLELKEAGLID